MSIFHRTKSLSNGVEVFYKEAGPTSKPVLLLLHGFPTSSRQFDQMIPHLSDDFHIIAPDLPFFGQTKIPANFAATFDQIAYTIELLLNELNIRKFSIYIFDYGAPTGLRLALNSKYEVSSIISQNGNAYVEGLEDFWTPLKAGWGLLEKTALTEEEQVELGAIKKILAGLVENLDPYLDQYYVGEPDPSKVNYEVPVIDHLLLNRVENSTENQIDLFLDYRNNVKKYPEFQSYFRESNVPILAVWGKNDEIFPKKGQQAYKRDSKNVKLVELDAGHFAGVTHAKDVANHILEFAKEFHLA